MGWRVLGAAESSEHDVAAAVVVTRTCRLVRRNKGTRLLMHMAEVHAIDMLWETRWPQMLPWHDAQPSVAAASLVPKAGQ